MRTGRSNNKLRKIYLIPIPTNWARRCINECGKCYIDLITLEGISWVPCEQENCPYPHEDTEIGIYEIEGYNIRFIACIRKFTDIKLKVEKLKRNIRD